MRYAKRVFGLGLPLLAWIALGVLAPCAVQADVVFTGNVTPAASGDWNANTDGKVGYSGGAGTALIDNASGLNSKNGFIGDSAAGTMTVDGTGSSWTTNAYWEEEMWGYIEGELYVGINSGGSGVLNITNGGAVNVEKASGIIGLFAAGTVSVDGPGSTWSMNPWWNEDAEENIGGNCYVGNQGTGVLSITSGGAVSDNAAYIAAGEGSSGIVTVNGSSWTNAGQLEVGYEGHGELSIQNGSTVSNQRCYVGHSGTATGEVSVSGNSTWTNDSYLYLGYGGTATLTIDSGGTVTAYRAYIGRNSSSTVTVSGAGMFKTNNTLYVGYYAEGVLEIDAGGMVNIGEETMYLRSTGHLDLNTGGTLFLDVNDAGNGVIDFYASTATADLGGMLKLDLTDVTLTEGLWTLVDNGAGGTLNYESSFDLMTSTGMSFTELNDVWTYTEGLSTWTFTESTGQLSLGTVPEPTTLALLACGLVGLLAYAWRKRK